MLLTRHAPIAVIVLIVCGIFAVPALGAAKRVLVPASDIGTDWRGGVVFDDSAWTAGAGGVGYGTSTGYEAHYDIDVEAEMYNQRGSCYIRIPFEVDAADLATFNFMSLRMRYDDAFAAYLNGVEVARSAGVPDPLTYNAIASDLHPNGEAISFLDYDLSPDLGELTAGANVLAIHGLNVGVASSDFLISCALAASAQRIAGGRSASAIEYTGGVALTQTTRVRARTLSAGQWSGLNQAAFAVGVVTESLHITEIMYHPDSDGLEFIEFYNAGDETLDLSGVYFSDGIEFTFPTGTLLEAGAYTVITQDQAFFATRYPAVPLSSVYTGQLSNGGERLEIRAPDASVILSITYNDAPPWPTAPDGQGFSLVLVDVLGDPGDAANWRPSTGIDGSPGTGEVPFQIPAVLVNEILTHTDLPSIDTIEIHNPTSTAVDLRGWFLTDDRMDPQRARIPGNAAYVLPPGGYAVVDESIFRDAPGSLDDTPLPGFALSALGGEDLYLFSAEATGTLTGYSHGIRFGAAENGVSFGRYVASDGVEHFPAQTESTLGAANAGPKVGPVVISAIHYHPLDGAIEFVELTNTSDAAVSLWDTAADGDPSNTWQLGGIGFAFGPDVTLRAHARLLVVNTTPAEFRPCTTYPPRPASMARLATPTTTASQA